jgi:hemerythrin-like domain-containing protein
MNEYVKILYDEHDIIVQGIEIAKKSKELIDKDSTQFEETVRKLIYFFRNYADKFHHYKEEEILFPAMAQKNEIIGEGIVQEMLDNHEDFRSLIKEIENNLDAKQYINAYKVLSEYTDKLLDHIAAENDELFLMSEQLFDVSELERMKFRFDDCDRDLGIEQKEGLMKMLAELKR